MKGVVILTLDDVYAELRKGNLAVMTRDVIMYINNRTVDIINRASSQQLNALVDAISIHEMEVIILISNMIYNNTDCTMLPLEDEVYEKLKNI